MVTRQQRLDDFDSTGEPPAGELMELLCEDHNGTYVRLHRTNFSQIPQALFGRVRA
jgi:hypothetical protein